MEITTIGLDVAKSVFEVHGVDSSGAVVLHRQLRRRQVERFFAGLPRCLVGIEACGTSHHWARRLSALGHEVRLIPPVYAKAYVRRNKTDAADAAAICEAVSRPSMRFVPIKSEAAQAVAAVHGVRDRLVAQRTMLQNALRGHMAEFGIVAPTGCGHVKTLVDRLADPDSVPAPLRAALLSLAELLTVLDRQIATVDRQILNWHRSDERSRRLAAIDGFGPILSSAMSSRVVQPERFRRARDFAAWLGLTPRQSGSGGRTRQHGISKKGDGYLRRLLVNGAQSVLNSKRGRRDPWIARLLERKPRMVVAVALANTMARIAWAVMVRETDVRRAVVPA